MISVENVILPNKPLSNFKLEDAAKRLKIPSFRVFLLVTLPEKPSKKECSIVNFDKSGGPGTHWVAWYNKRAMTALDRSPESFSPQLNSTSLILWFQLVTLRVGPVLIPRDI